MGFDQYHEPPGELSAKTRTFARMITSLIEEAEAIGWYEQRLALEKDREAKAIMRNAQHEEFKHFGMDLEFLLRKNKKWREVLQGILFQPGDIVEHGDEAEEDSECWFSPLSGRTQASASSWPTARAPRRSKGCPSIWRVARLHPLRLFGGVPPACLCLRASDSFSSRMGRGASPIALARGSQPRVVA